MPESITLLLETEASGDLEAQKGKGQGSNSSLKRAVLFLLNCKISTNFSVDSDSRLYATLTLCKRQATLISMYRKDKHKVLHKWLQQGTATNVRE